MRRRRGFDVDLPEAPEAAPDFPAGKEAAPRRGPMASAVRETAESLRARAETEAAIRAENDALAHELVRLRALGLTAEPVPLEAVDAAKLIRDRKVEPDPDVEDLKESIRAIGLSNPIRVERAGERYELIQGWRRLHAYRALLAETGDPAFAAIPAKARSEEHTSELQSLRRISYAVFCLKKKKTQLHSGILHMRRRTKKK